jgi:L-asparaginase/Glu-tRNA(Gln) amidotransferase subunit D
LIVLLFTGGTISKRYDPAAGGAVRTLRGREILELAPGVERLAPIEVDDWVRSPVRI